MSEDLTFKEIVSTCTTKELVGLLITYAQDIPTMRQMMQQGIVYIDNGIELRKRLTTVEQMRMIVEHERASRTPKMVILPSKPLKLN